jgi:hypothetical protein
MSKQIQRRANQSFQLSSRKVASYSSWGDCYSVSIPSVPSSLRCHCETRC